jgi:hypothetical protein
MNKKPTCTGSNPLRIIIQSAIMIIAGVMFFLFTHHDILGIILAASGTLIVIPGILIKPVSSAIVRFQHIVMKFIGILMTWLLLVPFFFLCFVPGRLILLILRKDPLERTFPTDKKSYWSPYSGSFDIDQFRRQY